MAQNKAGFDPTQTAEYWLEKKVYTVPLRSRSKRPKTKDWPHLRLVYDDLQNGAFKRGDNIGALWGKASDHATDVDLDMEEAIWVAEYILPETFIYGRTNKEYSHYIFRVVGAKTRKWQTADLGTIVEIRSTGAQSVIPPSRHPEGGVYYTNKHNNEEFTELTKLDLERFADEIAVAAVFVHYYPKAGSRHDYVHACTGALCHQQWPKKKIHRVMGAVLTVIQDEEDELDDRKGAVVNTIEKHEMGDRTKGFTTLSDWMSMQVVQALRRWTQSGTMETRVVTAPPEHIEPASDRLAFNLELMDVPGLVGDIVQWHMKSAYYPSPIFGLAAGIMCTALASCNNYIVQGWDTPLQPYLMLTAPTSAGKGGPLKLLTTFTRKIGMNDVVFRGFQSYYSLLDQLAEEGMACWIWDEAARHIASAKNPNGPDYQILSHVLSLYGAGNEWVPAMPGRKQSIPDMENPFFTLLATAQPDVLMEAITSSAQETGFMNRFILLDLGDDIPAKNPRRTNVVPSAIIRHAKKLINHEPADGDFTEVTFSEKTYNQFQEFEESSRRRSMRGELAWGRSNQNALIVAGLAAIGVNANTPVITPKIASWAIKLISWSNERWTEKARLTTSGQSRDETQSVRVEGIINNCRKYIHHKSNSAPQRIALDKGLMPYSVLQRCTRFPGKRLLEILEDLHEADLISSTELDDQIVYFPKRRR